MTTNIPMSSLADRAMLVYVAISVWSARKLDKKQTQKTISGAGATSDSARVNKHLLANADGALKEVQRKAGQIRDYVAANTLPWDDAGNRMISNVQALTTVGELQNMIDEFNKLVDAFVVEYPVMRAQAVANLGDMGDDSDYPQPDVVRKKFAVRLSYQPLPVSFGDIREGMSAPQADAWQNHHAANLRASVNGALSEAWKLLREDLERYSLRLQAKDDGSGKQQVFRDTMVSSLRNTCKLLKTLNVFEDKDLDRECDYVLREIAAHEPDALRASPVLSATVKNDVDDVLKRMLSYAGS